MTDESTIELLKRIELALNENAGQRAELAELRREIAQLSKAIDNMMDQLGLIREG
jgi:cell division protein FtsB